MKRLLLSTAALAAAVLVLIALSLPPRREALRTFADGTIPGLIHIHSNRSDGRGTVDEIAASAARAGLKFLVFTDHGDATRVPDPPTYRSGVLCLDGVEISTNGGHYIAIDMPASPYPLAGEARDVVDDVRRLGGFGIVAHPDSPKPQLHWRDWQAPFDAVELLNPDTSWRILAEQTSWATRRRLLAALVGYPVRPSEVMARLLQPTRALDKWSTLTKTRRVVALAGADAHAKLALRNGDPGEGRPSTSAGRPEPAEGRYAISLPGYEPSFRVFSIRVRPDQPLTGAAAADARVVMRAIRAGHLHTVVDGLATPAAFEFSATNERGTVHEGDEITVGGPLLLHVKTNAPDSDTTVIHDGTRVVTAQQGAQDWTVHASDRPGVFWVEILAPTQPQAITWLRSNPIYVRSATLPEPPPPPPPPTASQPLPTDTLTGWRVEHDPTSRAAVDLVDTIGGRELRFQYGLSGGTPGPQVAALAYDLPAGLAPYTGLTVGIRADRPTRISVQFRGGEGTVTDDRWQRSIFIDVSARTRTIDFDDLTPVGATHSAKPPLAGIRSILFVVDVTNTKPGTAGSIWVREVRLVR
jgi:hypothetical protein